MKEPQADQPCPCRSGRLYGKCCGSPDALRVLALSEQRPCGACQACCNLIGVKEVGKPFGTNCEHQCSAGCGIYDQRPDGCRTFFCFWKVSPHMSDDMRPDKSGILYFFQRGIVPGGRRETLIVYEVREGAFKTAPDAIYAELNAIMIRHPELSTTFIPFGKHQWNDYQTAPRYLSNQSYSRNMVQISDRICMVVDTVEEAIEYHSTLARRHAENAR